MKILLRAYLMSAVILVGVLFVSSIVFAYPSFNILGDYAGVGTNSTTTANASFTVSGTVAIPNLTNTILGTDGNGLIVATSSSAGSAGLVTTSTDITAGYVPYWFNVTGGLYGTSTLFISSSTGNVGIGTTSPGTKLEVLGVVSSTEMRTPSSTIGTFNFTNASGTNITVSGYGTFPTLNFTTSGGGTLTNVSSTRITASTGYDGGRISVTNASTSKLDATGYIKINGDAVSTSTGGGGSSNSLTFAAFAGENASTGMAMSIMDTGSMLLTNATSANGVSFGCTGPDTNCSNQLAQSFILSASTSISTLGTFLAIAGGAPADNVVLSIRADSGNCPTGVDLASTTIANASIGADLVNLSSSTNATTTLSPGVRYWFYIDRTGAMSGSTWWRTMGYTDNRYFFGKEQGVVGGSCGDMNTIDITFNTGINSPAAIIASGNVTRRTPAIGFNTTDVIIGDTATIQTNGTASLFSGLTIGAKYYLGTASGTISLASSTYNETVGIAQTTSTLSLFIVP